LAALLFNIDRFSSLASIKEEAWHSDWTKSDFGYRYVARTPPPVEFYDINGEMADRENAERAQEEMLTNFSDHTKCLKLVNVILYASIFYI
jgi:hypothetical protein